MKRYFIKATEEYNSLEAPVPAYYFRRAFSLDGAATVKITVAVCGIYEIYLDGERITRGYLSPYLSNPDHFIYYDEYEVSLDGGEHAIGLWLGNGFHNNPGGFPWDFDKATFRSAPMMALVVTRGEELLLHSGEGFRVAPSPIRSDDYRLGECYDARYEIPGWCRPGFDDTAWAAALPAVPPKGELRLADVAPIRKEEELSPVAIYPCEGGYVYDFGVSNAGICRLTVSGAVEGQRIVLRYDDRFVNGDLDLVKLWFPRFNWERDREIIHRDDYVCKGAEREIYESVFTYHGFRYVKVTGITEAQATPELLTFIVYHTELHERGSFECSDPVATKLRELTQRSLVSNFHHFPTDCPHREKNGWTGDAALTCETALLYYDPERNYRERLRNICRAQREDGAIPGIVPTAGWGFAWGNGPLYDAILAYLPYYVYVYRGRTEMIEEAAPALRSYLSYLQTRRDERGLLAIGLCDWCDIGRPVTDSKAPLAVTDTVMAMDIAKKTAVMLTVIGDAEGAAFARREADFYRAAVRESLIDFETATVKGECQTSQAFALYYGVLEKDEEAAFFARLLEMIHAAGDFMSVGVFGARVLFHVLSSFGESELALRMITREEYPSYGNWIARGATALFEMFLPEDKDEWYSKNHHFWGHVSAWFIKCLAGIRLNPHENNVNELTVAPAFPSALDHVTAYHDAPAGRIEVAWRREGDAILLDLQIPEGVTATAELPRGYRFECGESVAAVKSGSYRIAK